MAYTLSSKCAKNLCKRIVLLQLVIKNVVTCFFGTQYIVAVVTYNFYNFNTQLTKLFV